MSMEMEEFYAQARDADYIIYNSTIDGEISSVENLTAKNPLFSNFKAVQNGNVYCTSQNLYQSTMELGSILADLHGMLSGNNEALTYIYRLELSKCGNTKDTALLLFYCLFSHYFF